MRHSAVGVGRLAAPRPPGYPRDGDGMEEEAPKKRNPLLMVLLAGVLVVGLGGLLVAGTAGYFVWVYFIRDRAAPPAGLLTVVNDATSPLHVACTAVGGSSWSSETDVDPGATASVAVLPRPASCRGTHGDVEAFAWAISDPPAPDEPWSVRAQMKVPGELSGPEVVPPAGVEAALTEPAPIFDAAEPVEATPTQPPEPAPATASTKPARG